MRVIKKINNNAAICLDDNNNELVAIGTGVGFPKVPYELTDLSVIQRTFYDVDAMYYDLLNLIPEDVLNISIKIVDIFKSKTYESISSNLVFTLADHIHFAIERCNKNMKIDTPLQYDIQHLYELEYGVGLTALKMINKELKVHLPKGEASNIAMHLINATTVTNLNSKQGYIDSVINDVTDLISQYFKLYIDRNSFHYSRFVSHLLYLLKRGEKGELIISENHKLFETIIEEYQDTYECVLKIKEYLYDEMDIELNEEEILYLILHVNRLCVREDCYRKSITPTQENK